MNRPVALIVLLFVFANGCRSREPVIQDRPKSFPGVVERDTSFHSESLSRDMPYRVYLPTQAPSGTKLSVIYLLHGGGGSYQDWSNYSEAGSYAVRGIILVMPEGNSSYYVNSATNRRDRYEDYLARDLIHDVETRFPVIADRQHRAIVGVSMGGYAAIKLALSRPDLFIFAGAISPAVDVPSRRFSWRRWSQSMRFRAIFGPDGSEMRRAGDPFLLVRTANPAATPYIYLTAGEQEPLLDPIRRFAERLKDRRFRYELHTKPGGHDWNEWDAQIPGCFDSLLAHLPNRP